MKRNGLTWLLQLSILLRDSPDADFAELDFAGEVVHLQQDAAFFMTVFSIAAVGCGLAVDPSLQMVANGTDPHRDPLTIFRCRFGRTCAFYLQGVDAARRVVTVTMV